MVGQPLTVDPSRAPEGAGMLWIQLQELPWTSRATPPGSSTCGDGRWTEELRERYADRIQARLARHIPNLESSIRARVALSPADLEAANINLERGDPYSGSLTLDQNFLWRPLPGAAGPRDKRRAALPDRRQHASRAGARRRVRDARRAGAPAAAPARPRREPRAEAGDPVIAPGCSGGREPSTTLEWV